MRQRLPRVSAQLRRSERKAGREACREPRTYYQKRPPTLKEALGSDCIERLHREAQKRDGDHLNNCQLGNELKRRQPQVAPPPRPEEPPTLTNFYFFVEDDTRDKFEDDWKEKETKEARKVVVADCKDHLRHVNPWRPVIIANGR
jgi:hypothetical protein